jgi:hypothetical protein
MIGEKRERNIIKLLIAFRNRCVEERTPIEIALAMLLAKLSNSLVISFTTLDLILSPENYKIYTVIQLHADIIFWSGIGLIITAILLQKGKIARFLMISYTILMTFQLTVNVLILITGAHSQIVKPLYYLGDVALVYLMYIFVFTAWYWIADTEKKGRAFLFPGSEGIEKEHPDLHFIDYLFIAFNVSATFGPTNEVVLSMWAKVLMMLQTAMSMVIIVVLASRAASMN